MNTVDIAALIRIKRKEKGLKQKELAALLHVSAAAVSKWENGKNFPDLGNMQALSRLLGIPMSELLGDFPQSSSPESDTNHVTLEPSDTAIPDIEDASFPETPVLPVSQPEDVSEPPPSVQKWMRPKIVIPLLTSLLAGIIAVCWIAGGWKNKTPSFMVCDTYYGDYMGEDVYYVITEFESHPTGEDLLNFNELIRKQYAQHFSAVNRIVIIYAQDYTNYIENGFDDETDHMGVILPIPE